MRSNHRDSRRLAPGVRTSRRAGRRLAAAVAGVLTVVAGGTLTVTGTASAASATVSVSPSSGLADGGSVQVTVTTPAVTPSGVFVGVTQCGNATSSGTPLSALAADGSDCMGAAGLGSTLQIIGTIGVGAVPAGAHSTSLILKETGIGTADTKCIAMPPATLPCQIVAATANTSGSYTGTGSFTGSAGITYANNATSTTTTVAHSTTSTTRAGSTTSSTSPGQQQVTTNVSNSSTTSTTTASSNTTVAAVAGGGSSSTTSVATSPTTKPAGSLAFTGPPKLTWLLALIALGLLDIGYLAVSATRRAKAEPASRP